MSPNLNILGHTHMTNIAPLHDCGTHKMQQVILTSVNAQLDWKSDTKAAINYKLMLILVYKMKWFLLIFDLLMSLKIINIFVRLHECSSSAKLRKNRNFR